MSAHGSKGRRASEAVPESGPKAGAEITTADQKALEVEPNWDRMGQIAKRLLITKTGQTSQRVMATHKSVLSSTIKKT